MLRTFTTRAHLLHIGVDPALFTRVVRDLCLQLDPATLELTAVLVQLEDLCVLGQGLLAVRELSHSVVDALHIEQAKLGERIGFQGGLLMRASAGDSSKDR